MRGPREREDASDPPTYSDLIDAATNSSSGEPSFNFLSPNLTLFPNQNKHLKDQPAHKSNQLSGEKVYDKQNYQNDVLDRNDNDMVVTQSNKKSTPTKTSLQRKPVRKASVSNVVHEVEKLRLNREARRLQMHADRAQRAEAWEELAASGWLSDIDFHRMIEQYRAASCSDELPFSTARKPGKERICVFLRKRPISVKEVNNKECDCITVQNPRAVVHECKLRVDGITKYLDHNHFSFDATFNEDTPTSDVYKTACKPLIDFIFKQHGRATVFAYGQTGSGKTYTMVGVQHLLCQDFFDAVESFDEEDRPEIQCSFFEIYGGRVYDLLNNRNQLTVLEDGQNEVQVTGMTARVARNGSELKQVIEFGNAIRTTASTTSNQDSSRSHAVCTLTVRDKSATIIGKLSLVDLAGSERAQEAKDCGQERRIEGAEINKSLLALKECVRAMDTNAGHVPFRASKLTMLLRDSFVSQKSRTVMIACVSPGSASADHTVNTLRYADRLTTDKRDSRKEPVERGSSDPREMQSDGNEFVFRPAARGSLGSTHSSERETRMRDSSVPANLSRRARATRTQSGIEFGKKSPGSGATAPSASRLSSLNIQGLNRSPPARRQNSIPTTTATAKRNPSTPAAVAKVAARPRQTPPGPVPGVPAELHSSPIEAKSSTPVPRAKQPQPTRKVVPGSGPVRTNAVTSSESSFRSTGPAPKPARRSTTPKLRPQPEKHAPSPMSGPPELSPNKSSRASPTCDRDRELFDLHMAAMQQDALLLKDEGDRLSRTQDYPGEMDSYVEFAAEVMHRKIDLCKGFLEQCRKYQSRKRRSSANRGEA